jgi:hypothetical protein
MNVKYLINEQEKYSVVFELNTNIFWSMKLSVSYVKMKWFLFIQMQ